MSVKEMLFGNDLNDMRKFTVTELKRFAKELGIKGISKMSKESLALAVWNEIK